MSKTIRQPLYNAFLQTDLDVGQKFFRNVGGLDLATKRIAIVDGTNGSDSNGKVNSMLAYQTLGAALAGCLTDRRIDPTDHSGYVILWRPGLYKIDGAQEIALTGVTILAYGVILTSDTAVNEETKLIVTAPDVTIKGLTIDGAVATGSLPAGYDTVDQPHGLLEINMATTTRLYECSFLNAAASGIYGTDGYTNLYIENCMFEACQMAIFGAVGTSANVENVTIRGNIVDVTRRGGIKLKGSGDSTTAIGFRNLKIQANDISRTDSSVSGEAAIHALDFLRDAIVSNNHLSTGTRGIRVQKCVGLNVSINSFSAMTTINMEFDGCQQVNFIGNTLDASRLGSVGIVVADFFRFANDSGPFLISNNTIFGAAAGTEAVAIQNSNNVLLSSNRIEGFIQFGDTNAIQMIGNVVQTIDSALIIESSARAFSGILIANNRFIFGGVGQTRAITFLDIFGGGIGGTTLIGNSVTDGKVFSDGIIVYTGTHPTPMHQVANVPQSTVRSGATYDGTRGWVNDDMVFQQADQFDIPASSAFGYSVGGQLVVKARMAGWGVPTGTRSRAVFDPSTVTLAVLGQHVAAILDDLASAAGHGLIGP